MQRLAIHLEEGLREVVDLVTEHELDRHIREQAMEEAVGL